MQREYARIGGMVLVPMKAPPGRPLKGAAPRTVQLQVRVEPDLDKALDVLRGDRPRSEVLYEILADRLRQEGLLPPSPAD